MADYIPRDIKDRIAEGDNKFIMTELGDGRIELTPAPDSVTEVGTPINKELLQWMEDNICWLLNQMFSEITSNPFSVTFDSINGLNVRGIWNKPMHRLEV